MEKQLPSIRARLALKLIARVTSSKLIGQKIRRGEHLTKLIEPPWKCPKGYHLEVIKGDVFVMEMLRQQPIDAEQATQRDLGVAVDLTTKVEQPLIVLQLHGGGYIGRLRNVHRNMAKFYIEFASAAAVLTPDYRVAPKHPYPAALKDALASFNWLMAQGYTENQIVIAGDSAGGGLAMALCLYLKTHGRKLPRAIIAMSPWTDMTASGESYQFNFEKDPLFGNTTDSVLFNRDYVGDESEDKPYVSPLFGNFEGFPPMLIQAGSYEMLLSDAINVAQKATDSGVTVDLQIYEGMFHDFQMAGHMIPESKEAWLAVGRFIENLMI